MTNETITEVEIAHRNAIAYLKGQIVAYAIQEGMKHESKRTPSEQFQKGMDSIPRGTDKDWVTLRHMAHNKLRHYRSHTDCDYYSLGVIKDIKELTGFSPDELETVKNG